MLWETIERVNRMRQKAMSDPEFHKTAQEHAKTLEFVEQEFEYRRIRRKKTKLKKPKSLADIYQKTSATDDENPSGIEH
ncbi:hypothetical protein [Vibrio salinus]|uniref:hypothetical protein n=1 Tax=Vibrio salinus TaxID=2899784 RepID=UPI001E516A26|nr:hypothetical protein [Vibrio salinus]MCE0495902.1 hypothetical protein [Vibrio salinus]